MTSGLILTIHSLLVGWFGLTAASGDDAHSASQLQVDEHVRLMKMLLSNDTMYSTFRPHLHGDQVDVTCFLSIDSFGSVTALSMDYSVNMDLYIQWVDDRLVHNSSSGLVFQTVESIKRFWLPDIYFLNEKQGDLHQILSENIALSLQPDGNITYSTRLTLSLTCYMKLQLFPLDVQKCPLGIRSYAYSSDHVILRWRSFDPILSDPNIIIPQYSLVKVNTRMQFDETPFGNFSTLEAEFVLERSLGFFIVNLFLPSFLLVITSWISFWLHVDATPARASLGITSVLTLVTQSGSIRYTVPSLSYPTAMDIWFSTCIFFVFAALLEFALVNYFYTLSVRVSKKEIVLGVPEDVQDNTSARSPVSPDDEKIAFEGDKYTQERNGDRRPRQDTKSVKGGRRQRALIYLQRASQIDKYSRIGFPMVFAVFFSLFWIVFPVLRNNLDYEAKSSFA
ncbi:glycine receptor subunit alpha-1-like [Glandiceps talaboti]